MKLNDCPDLKSIALIALISQGNRATPLLFFCSCRERVRHDAWKVSRQGADVGRVGAGRGLGDSGTLVTTKKGNSSRRCGLQGD